MPGEPLPAQHPERTDDADHVGRVALDDGGVHHVGQDGQVPLRAGRAVEEHPLAFGVVLPAQQPAGEPVDEPSGRRQGGLAQGRAGDLQLGPLRPGRGVRLGLEDGAAAGDPSLVHRRPQGVVHLFQQHGSERRAAVGGQAALLQLFGQSLQAAGLGLDNHATDTRSGPTHPISIAAHNLEKVRSGVRCPSSARPCPSFQ